ncbi:toll/interleukin-1 receptor domain-containing protein [Sphingobacterium daejeonense]|uniref:toll/interleukin-1 receptor domain-containing protein n=1 Tax=Sphingobacterium daejeonense TaxID=371142 RepID=UPI0021A82913|nr:toll/interleukin-1 receptor domain-containing protein [Sphingobacterium daejeonense]MCT1529907.1 toll/interleukin-1 receptor domain-containing protein [Sphingobacterium daejeonense]
MENQDQDLTKKYKAFISYSHSDNQGEGRKWADWLHHALETYEIPEDLIGKKNAAGEEIPRQIYPVFQDEKELSASSSLSGSLTSALDRSEFLIYLSSPKSARSTYVRDELKYFKQTGKSQKIIALIIKGEPEYGKENTDAQCFPDELRYNIDETGKILYDQPEEVLAADVRIPNTQEEGFTSAEGYRRYLHDKGTPNHQIKGLVDEYKKRLDLALLKIISGILGVPLAELTKRDQAYQLEKIKQKNRNIKRIATAIGALGVIAILAGIFAWNQRNSALKNLAKSLYASGINKLTESEYGDGAAYIAEATRRGDESAALFAHSMLAVQEDLIRMPNINFGGIRFSPNGKWIVGFASAGDNSNVLQVWDATTRKQLVQRDDISSNQPRFPQFDEKDNAYVVNSDLEIVRYNMANDKKDILRPNLDSSFISLTAISPDSKFIVINKQSKDVIFFNTVTKQEQILIKNDQLVPTSAYFDKTSKTLYISRSLSEGNELTIYDLATDIPKEIFKKSTKLGSNPPAFSKDGNQIAFRNSEGLYYFNKSNVINWFLPGPFYIKFLGFTDNGNLYIGDEAQIVQVNTNNGSTLKNTELPRNIFFLTDLMKMMEKDPSDEDATSPDWSQYLVSNNSQTFIENKNTTPLRVAQYYEEGGLSHAHPGITNDEAFLRYKGKPALAKLNLKTGQKNSEFIKIPEEIALFLVLQKSKKILVKGISGKTYFFDASNGKPVGKPFDSQVKTYIFNKDETEVMARTSNKSFAAWDIATGKQTLNFAMDQDIPGFTVSPDFKTVVMVKPDGWSIMDIASKKVLAEGKETINSGAFSPTSEYLVIISKSGDAKVLKTTDYKPIFQVKTIAAPFIVFNNEGNVMALSEDATHMRLWNLETKKSFGQNIRISRFTQYFHFSDDDSKIFVQDDGERFAFAAKVVDAKSGNILTMPFINQKFDGIYIMPGDKQIMTVESLVNGMAIHVWETPGQVSMSKDQLARDLEKFYGKKYDNETGAILNYTDSTGDYNTWYFEDPFLRTVSPSSNEKITDVLKKNYPIKNEANLQLLAVTYDYHPLARAMVANYFSSNPDTKLIGQRLVEITDKQLLKIKNKELKTEVENLLKEAKQNLSK